MGVGDDKSLSSSSFVASDSVKLRSESASASSSCQVQGNSIQVLGLSVGGDESLSSSSFVVSSCSNDVNGSDRCANQDRHRNQDSDGTSSNDHEMLILDSYSSHVQKYIKNMQSAPVASIRKLCVSYRQSEDGTPAELLRKIANVLETKFSNKNVV